MKKDLQIPAQFYEQSTLSPGVKDSFFFERYIDQDKILADILAPFNGRRHVVDFGCNVGGWAWQLSDMCDTVTALDISNDVLKLGTIFIEHNGISNIDFKINDSKTLESLPSADGIVCLITLQLMKAAEIHRFFDFARQKLNTGGLLLCNSVGPRFAFEWLVTMKTVRNKGWHSQILWAIRLFRVMLMKKIAPSPFLLTHLPTRVSNFLSCYYCLRSQSVIRLANDNGFKVVRSPKLYKDAPEIRDFELSTYGKTMLRHFDWYLFERVKE